MYDGRDLYTEVLNGEEWKVGRNLHEIIGNIPDFIEAIKQAEDQAIEMREVREAQNLLEGAEGEQAPETIFTEVYGKYHLGEIYDMSHFHNTASGTDNQVPAIIYEGKHTNTCSVFACLEQDCTGAVNPDGVFYARRIVVTESCFLMFNPIPES